MNMHGGDRVNAFQLRGREDYFLTSGFRKINSPGKVSKNKVYRAGATFVCPRDLVAPRCCSSTGIPISISTHSKKESMESV